MSQVEHVVLKGDKQGVSILIRDGVELATALEELRRKVAPARSFFVGAPVRVAVGGRDLLPDELQTLAAAVGELGLTLVHPVEKVLMRRSGSPAPGSDEKTSAGDAALLHKKTLRSGQRIDHDGNVVILGDVNPGAVVTCTGDIVVMGTLRGVAGLVGYLTTRDGARLVFAELVNTSQSVSYNRMYNWLDRSAALTAACGCH